MPDCFNSLVSGEVSGSATAKNLPSIPCRLALIQAEHDNVGRVFWGGPGVTKPDGITDTTSGLPLAASSFSPWLPIENLSQLYIICDNAGDDIVYVCLT